MNFKILDNLDYSSVLNNKNILITGGTGSFGHQMINELKIYKPKIIRILSRDEDKQHNMRQELLQEPIFKKMQFVIGDVRDYPRMLTVAKDIDIIFHAAALKHVPAVESHPYEACENQHNWCIQYGTGSSCKKSSRMW